MTNMLSGCVARTVICVQALEKTFLDRIAKSCRGPGRGINRHHPSFVDRLAAPSGLAQRTIPDARRHCTCDDRPNWSPHQPWPASRRVNVTSSRNNRCRRPHARLQPWLGHVTRLPTSGLIHLQRHQTRSKTLARALRQSADDLLAHIDDADSDDLAIIAEAAAETCRAAIASLKGQPQRHAKTVEGVARRLKCVRLPIDRKFVPPGRIFYRLATRFLRARAIFWRSFARPFCGLRLGSPRNE